MVVIRCDRSIASRLPSAAQFSAQSMTKGSLSSLRDCQARWCFRVARGWRGLARQVMIERVQVISFDC